MPNVDTPPSDRRARAEQVAAQVRLMLIAIAEEQTTGEITIHIGAGLPTSLDTFLVTGERTAWALPDLRATSGTHG